MVLKIEEWSVNDVVKILQGCDKNEFIDFVKEKEMDGRKLLEITEGMIKLWRPKSNAKDFILFIENMRNDPSKYLKYLSDDIVIKETNLTDSQYQTVIVRKISQQDGNFSSVEDILKKIVAPKSFLLYRNKNKTSSYVPMDGAKKQKKFFRLSSYDYPIFDLKSKFSKVDNCDRGYYSIKTKGLQRPKKSDTRTKYKSLPTPEINENYTEDHLYEDLCYPDVETKKEVTQSKPMSKIQELFQSFRFPFFKKLDESESKKEAKEEVGHIYENNDSVGEMYDSVHVQKEETGDEQQRTLAVEDYLVPVNIEKDYCDVCLKQKEESLLGYIMNYLETRFGRRETNEAQSDISEVEPSCDDSKWERKPNMAARPLPVPVENEPFYMNIDRQEAENLLLGQPDGTFILRPSSQPNHAYTLSVSCANAVHNVGVRRRSDGRLALGFARRGERSFATVTSLLQHHKKRRLLLVAGGDMIGATTLTDTPQYYQTPKNIPIGCKEIF
ncbi:uncharacterized protein LOC125054698 isoform X1 [Pieris napi]|uniref:uncharacterized protein LOC125054698 isoform X1 n=1 Tax=Pieris napi TaxID=78633 RepID=UPI001FBAB870|nr:uncharacterized protein LOC125054698 isoform X1 [Pieris napi]XP_047512682.1 uncharacterized protein LOC125054698 isoform X1 [Pieris napi]